MADQKDLTAVDHVNNKMLQAFKSHLETGKVKIYEEQKDDNDDEWDDTGAIIIEIYSFFADYTNESLPTQDAQILKSEENPKEEEKN